MPYATQRQIEDLDGVAGQIGMANLDAWVKRRYGREEVAGAADLTSDEMRQLIAELREVVVGQRSEAFLASVLESDQPRRARQKNG